VPWRSSWIASSSRHSGTPRNDGLKTRALARFQSRTLGFARAFRACPPQWTTALLKDAWIEKPAELRPGIVLVVALAVFVPSVLYFTELALRQLRMMWWLILLLAGAVWLLSRRQEGVNERDKRSPPQPAGPRLAG